MPVGLIERWVNRLQGAEMPSETVPGAERRLIDPERIARVLQQLVDGRALVSVRLPGSDEYFLTTILRVDRRQRSFRLDEISPRHGHDVFLAERSLRASCRLSGIEVAFSGTLASVAVEQGIAVYTLPFPHLLHYHQRRASYRASVGAGNSTTLHMQHAEAGMLVAEVRDVSTGGLGLRMQLPDTAPLASGDRLSDCLVFFPDGRSLRCELEVSHVARREGSRWTLVGTRFIQIQRRDQVPLAQFIVRLERERLKLRPPGEGEG